MTSAAALINYPNVSDARLPATYETAKSALANCERIDECAEWANKMEALASYARQSENDELLKYCLRIKARAIRRCGELLQEVEPRPGARSDIEPEVVSRPRSPTRGETASAAGLSPHQAKQALRVANVSTDDFEVQIDSEMPPTITALAEQGKATRPTPAVDLKGRNPADFAVATQGLGTIAIFVEFIGKADIDRIIRGGFEHELSRMKDHLCAIREWIDEAEGALYVVLGK